MAELKNIASLKTLEEVGENTTIIVEDEGLMKRLPASNFSGGAGADIICTLVSATEDSEGEYSDEVLFDMEKSTLVMNKTIDEIVESLDNYTPVIMEAFCVSRQGPKMIWERGSNTVMMGADWETFVSMGFPYEIDAVGNVLYTGTTMALAEAMAIVLIYQDADGNLKFMVDFQE